MSLFSRSNDKKNTVVPGLGTIHSQGVGDTTYVTGLDHQFLAEDADKPVPGVVRFSAYVSDTGEIAWRFVFAEGPLSRAGRWNGPKPAEDTQLDYPAAAVAEMRRLSETLQEREQTSWFFHALGAVDIELRARTDRDKDIRRTISLLEGLLAKQSEPVKHFVSAEEAGQPKGFHRLATADEKAARRLEWSTRLDERRTALETLKVEQDDRVAMLTRLRDTLRDWSGRKAPRQSPFDLYAQALAA